MTCGVCDLEEIIQTIDDITTYYKALEARAELEKSVKRIAKFFNKKSSKHAKDVLSRKGRMKGQNPQKVKES